MHRVRLASLVRVFAWTGLTSIGGGRSAYFHQAVVVRRSWVGDDEFLQDLTLSQVLPGPNFSNLATALGHRLAGVVGAASGLVAVLVPGALILVALARLYFGVGVVPALSRAMHGMSAAVVGLMLVTTVRLSRPAFVDLRAAAIAAATFVAVGPLRVNTVLVIAVMATLSLWVHRPARAR